MFGFVLFCSVLFVCPIRCLFVRFLIYSVLFCFVCYLRFLSSQLRYLFFLVSWLVCWLLGWLVCLFVCLFVGRFACSFVLFV